MLRKCAVRSETIEINIFLYIDLILNEKKESRWVFHSIPLCYMVSTLFPVSVPGPGRRDLILGAILADWVRPLPPEPSKIKDLASYTPSPEIRLVGSK